MTHMRTDHLEKLSEFKASMEQQPPFFNSSTKSLHLSRKSNTLAINGWLRRVADNVLPCHVCKINDIAVCLKHKHICKDTLIKYSKLLTEQIERKITSEVRDKFEVKFYRGLKEETHFIAIYFSFSAGNHEGFNRICVGSSPL